MTQVSKRLMSSQLKDKVDRTFWETVVKTNKHEDAALFFSDLFTRAERINFVKRLSIAVLLHKGYEWRSICDLLKVSLTTIAKVAGKVDHKGFRLFFERIDKDENWREFWRDLAKVYLVVTHGDKVARLGSEGVERVYFRKKKNSLI
ncbi:hypothetical protein A2696_01160 [Candidatus Curtissbacteria bacterium RIFCSPHIGHO2_01_FULL_41_13]|uniref:Uncharacterized protein n=1 Tax=Candidatus Curtissbacteria bacterium RIFCSPHIGHO2_01_FULL_41_13 TaxID=1797745 RepID=A0A1F5FZR6_9BACT|nr:MAG: hypothetical protein A2696_01160 [Candidatus Curtissbacteria bacterium RIFCSPHIGHO2_01_FULL_41_13]